MNTEMEMSEAASEFPDSMSVARHGKIARLPRALREELNRRLADGHTGLKILAWINAHPDARQVLDSKFGGKDVNHQNLSQWRRGGFDEWLRYQTAIEDVRKHRGPQVSGRALREKVMDRLGAMFAAKCAMTLHEMSENALSAKKTWVLLREGLREVRTMRNREHREARERMKTSNIQHRTSNIHRSTNNQAAGNELGKSADVLAELSALYGVEHPDAIPPNPGKSDLFKVIQSEKKRTPATPDTQHPTGVDPALPVRREGELRAKPIAAGAELVSQMIAEVFGSACLDGIKANQGQSDLFKVIQSEKITSVGFKPES